jgi:hypothetical protein
MDPVLIPDHAQQAIARLPSQFAQSITLQALITALCGPQQVLEQTLYDTLTLRRISTADGVQLDNIGQILNVPRNGLTDANYQVALRGAASVLGQSGEPETLISTYEKIWGASLVQLFEIEPATVQLSAQTVNDTQSSSFDAQVRLALTSAKAAGVQLILEVAPGPVTQPGGTVIPGGMMLADKSQADASGNGPQLPNGGGLADMSQVDANGNGPLGAGGLGRVIP